MTRTVLTLVFAALLLSIAAAQRMSPPIGPGSLVPLGPSSQTAGSSGVPPTPCNAGQLDWSDATGCNLTLMFTVMR